MIEMPVEGYQRIADRSDFQVCNHSHDDQNYHLNRSSSKKDSFKGKG